MASKAVQRARYVVLIGILTVLLGFYFFYEPTYEEHVGPQQRIMLDRPVPEFSAPRVNPDDVFGIPMEVWDASESEWRRSEHRAAKSVIQRTNADLLILPVHGRENAFDPVERSLMSRLIADRVQRDAGWRVLDPSQVLRYLGSHKTYYSGESVMALADLARSETILALEARHDRRGTWELTATLISGQDASTIEQKTWSDLEYSHKYPPSIAIESMLPEIVELATRKKIKDRRKKPSFKVRDFDFPDSLDDLRERADRSPLHSAAYLQLVAMLHPQGAHNDYRDGLFERSLVELSRISADAPYSAYFRARAYAYLDRRPAAVAALGEPRNLHERALLEALNGNLEDLQSLTAEMGTTALDFMAWRDQLFLEDKYEAAGAEGKLQRFTDAHPGWAPFIYRAGRDFETWPNYSAATMKLGLESLLPGEVPSLETDLNGKFITGSAPEEIDLVRLLWKHIESFDHSEVRSWLSERGNTTSFTPADILELAKSTAVANHLRRLVLQARSRDLPEAALGEIAEFEPFFGGHPAVEFLEGSTLKDVAEDAAGSEKENLELAAAKASLNGFAWSRRMDYAAVHVARNYWNYLRQASVDMQGVPTGGRFGRYSQRYHEWPRASNWLYRYSRWEQRTGGTQHCIDYKWHMFECVELKIRAAQRRSDDPDRVADILLTAYSDRYKGSPRRNEYKVERSRESEDENSEIRTLESLIESGKQDWPLYQALGLAYKRRGDYEKAQEVWLSFPGFFDGDRDTAVHDSNEADFAGSQFYWIGQHELAIPLMQIAANSRTGAGSSMSSATRIALIEGKLEEAVEHSIARVRRYGSKYAVRDLQQLFHILGESETAWNLFDQVQANRQDAQTWAGALIGHRMQSASTADILEWINASETRRSATMLIDGANYTRFPLARRYLLIAGTMDRAPGSKLAAAMKEIPAHEDHRYFYSAKSDRDPGNPRAWSRVSGTGELYTPDPMVSVGPVDKYSERHKQPVDGRYAMLAAAMSAFLSDDHELSFELFNELAYFYKLDEYLPYYAFSASVVGNAHHIEAALQAREPKLEKIRRNERPGTSRLGFRFDEDLTYGVLAALEGRHDAALEYLNAALNNRPFMNERTIFPMYEIVDLADRLYRQTGEDRYRDFALDLSRRHTVVLPQYAWAYYVVAEYSDSSAERVDAAASGLKLDPLSHRGSKLSPELLDKAREVLETRGAPYLHRGTGMDRRQT